MTRYLQREWRETPSHPTVLKAQAHGLGGGTRVALRPHTTLFTEEQRSAAMLPPRSSDTEADLAIGRRWVGETRCRLKKSTRGTKCPKFAQARYGNLMHGFPNALATSGWALMFMLF